MRESASPGPWARDGAKLASGLAVARVALAESKLVALAHPKLVALGEATLVALAEATLVSLGEPGLTA